MQSAKFLLACLAVFVSVCLFFDQATFASETIELKLAWDANTEPNLDGYEIYYRDGDTGSEFQMIGDVYIDELVDPDNPMITITNLYNGVLSGVLSDPANPTLRMSKLSDNAKYYFALTAFDTEGNISNLSKEICTEITESTVTECRSADGGGDGGSSGGVGCFISTQKDNLKEIPLYDLFIKIFSFGLLILCARKG